MDKDTQFKIIKLIENQESVNILSLPNLLIEENKDEKSTLILFADKKINLLYSLMETIMNCVLSNRIGKILVKNFISCRLVKK